MSPLALELVGYAASAMIAVSLMLVSVVRLRIVNSIGAALFSVYGLLIGSTPVAALNGVIVVVNAVHLLRLMGRAEAFDLLRVPADSPYLRVFLSHHAADIHRYAPGFRLDPGAICVFVLRDAVPAGLFVGTVDGRRLEVALDHAIPAYRDLRVGMHLYDRLPRLLDDTPVESLVARPTDPSHERYLRRMGYERLGDALVRPLTPSQSTRRADRRLPGAPPP